MTGKLIALEGLDGCGKTTQGNILKAALEGQGRKVIFKREPGGTDVSERIREIILDKNIDNMNPLTEAYLYAAARCQLVHQVVLPALKEDCIVILDRFLLSSIAYQGHGRNLGPKTVLELNRLAVEDVKPDLTILFDMKKSEERMDRNKDRIELSSQEFFNRVYEGYMSAYNHGSTLVIDARDSIENISKQILNRVGELLK